MSRGQNGNTTENSITFTRRNQCFTAGRYKCQRKLGGKSKKSKNKGKQFNLPALEEIYAFLCFIVSFSVTWKDT